MIFTQMKLTFEKLPPRTISFRDFKNFVKINFDDDLHKALTCNPQTRDDYGQFLQVFNNVLDKHAPLKKRLDRGNQKPFMNKTLRKAIMHRSKLLNAFNKTKKLQEWEKYRKQRNYCVKLKNKAKKQYFSKLGPCNMNRNNFWRTLGPFFSNKKAEKSTKIILSENNKMITDDREIAEVFGKYFNSIIQLIKVPDYQPPDDKYTLLNDPIVKAIEKYKQHPSILKIKDSIKTFNPGFDFRHFSSRETYNAIQSCKKNKASTHIPINILKNSSELLCPYLTDLINCIVDDGIWPIDLGSAEIIPALKKKSTETLKQSYRPISVLPSVSKIFEKLLCDDLQAFMKDKLSPLLCGYRKQFSTQHALLRLIEKWKKCLDKNGTIATVLMDLSKAYDCIPHDLLIAKLNAYGLNKKALRLVFSYLTNRKQRVKINSTYSEWFDILIGVPQGSVLGPLLFNIFINDLFLFIDKGEICNFADDNTLFKCCDNLDEAKSSIENECHLVTSWFKINSLKMNPDKCHVMVLGAKTLPEDFTILVNDTALIVEDQVTLLGVTLDNKLNFNAHINTVCKEACRKLNALIRIAKYLNRNQKKMLINAFFYSHFNYCPLIWMFSSKTSNDKIEKLHKRALQIIESDFTATYENLMAIDGSITIHKRNLQFLMTEIYKTLHDLNPPFMKEIFVRIDSPYLLKTKQRLKVDQVKTSAYGLETASFRESQIWNTLGSSFKQLSSVNSFKEKIKRWDGSNCNCKICS